MKKGFSVVSLKHFENTKKNLNISRSKIKISNCEISPTPFIKTRMELFIVTEYVWITEEHENTLAFQLCKKYNAFSNS